MKVLMNNTPTAVMPITQTSLRGKKIAIDTSIIMYQYITAIRGSGDDLKGPDDKSTSHILAILSKTLYYLKIGLIPIHVIDGKASELKMKILSDRTKIKKEALSKLLSMENDELNREIPLTDEEQALLEDERIKLLKKTVSVSRKEMLEAAEIAQLLGVPCIFAPEEADSQCAYLSRNDLVDYVASEDMDLLTFGTKTTIRNFLKKDMRMVTLDDILLEGDISMDQFIDLCILLGCDYTDTIDGIGQKKAWELIVKYKSIEQIIEKEKKIAENKYKLPENFRYVESREYFQNPRHVEITENDLTLKIPQLNQLKTVLIDKYGFSENNVEHMIEFLRKKYNCWDEQYEDNKKKKEAKESVDVFSDDDIISTKTIPTSSNKSIAITSKPTTNLESIALTGKSKKINSTKANSTKVNATKANPTNLESIAQTGKTKKINATKVNPTNTTTI